MPVGLNVLLPRLFPLLILSHSDFKLKDGGRGWGGAMGRLEKEKKGVNCLPIDNSIITL